MMVGVVEISPPGVSGPQHLLIPDSYRSRHPYAIPTDVSLTLPPLTMNASDGYCMETPRNTRSAFYRGIPSPPSSECSQSHSTWKESSQSQDSAPSLPAGPHTPPYSSPESWASPLSYPVTPAPNMSEPATYDMPFTTLPVRQSSQRQIQPAYYAPHSSGFQMIPAPSSLLGGQVSQASYFLPARSISAYQTHPPRVSSGTYDYPSNSFPPNFAATAGQSFLPAPGTFTWHPSPYAQPLPAQAWVQPSQSYRPAKPTTIFGSLPREAWERIFQCLTYADRLRLQRVNRFWRTSLKALDEQIKAKPSNADFADMHALVLEAENYRKHWAPSMAAECRTHRGRPRNNNRNGRAAPAQTTVDRRRNDTTVSTGSLGCYHCFTVRRPENFCLIADKDDANMFDNSQDHNNNLKAAQRPVPRRYCLDCGIKKGFHKPGVYHERKWGIEVWICCMEYHNHGVMNCPRCGKGCPLTPVTRRRGAA